MNKALKNIVLFIGVFLAVFSFSVLPLVYSIEFEQVNTTGTQTLTNKTLTAPIITSPTISGTTTIGSGATLTSPTITSPTISSPTISGTTSIGSGATITSPTITSPTITGTTSIGSGATITGPTISSPVLSGTVTGTYTLGGTPTISAGALSVATACASGYTEVRGWCFDTDSTLTQIRTTTSNDASFVTVTAHANAKLVLLAVLGRIQQDGTGENTGEVNVCTMSADGTAVGCPNPIAAAADLANEQDWASGQIIMNTDSSGQIKTKCLLGGTGTTGSCTWWLFAYMP